MADKDAFNDLLDRLLAGDQDYEQDYVPGTEEDNAANVLDEAIATLDKMASEGMRLANLLTQQRKFNAQVFATLAAVIVLQGGTVRLTKEQLRDTGDRMLEAKWDGDDLLLTTTAKAVAE